MRLTVHLISFFTYTLEFDCCLALILYCYVSILLRIDSASGCTSQRLRDIRRVLNAPGSLRMHAVVDRSGCLLCPNNVLRHAPTSSVPAVDLDHRIETTPLFVHLLCLSSLACAGFVGVLIPHNVLDPRPRSGMLAGGGHAASSEGYALLSLLALAS